MTRPSNRFWGEPQKPLASCSGAPVANGANLASNGVLHQLGETSLGRIQDVKRRKEKQKMKK